MALGLDEMLTQKIYEVYNRQMNDATGEEVIDNTSHPSNNGGIFVPDETNPTEDVTSVQPVDDEEQQEDPPQEDVVVDPPVVVTTTAPIPSDTSNIVNRPTDACQSTTYSDWSTCSQTCGDGGIQFRYRTNSNQPVETQPCPTNIASTLPACGLVEEEQCVPEFGIDFQTSIIASNLDSPRDLAFHPTPGIHLGSYSEGRTFHPNHGEELWVANGNNHSISIIASLGTEYQTSISRRDRGYYHYMNNITALAFNTVKDVPTRSVDQDTFNYFAVCNDNLNDYVGTKEPNYFIL